MQHSHNDSFIPHDIGLSKHTNDLGMDANATWKILFLRHMQQLEKSAAPLFLSSVSSILSDSVCPNIEYINAFLKPYHWTSCLLEQPISYKNLFDHYANRMLPLPSHLRTKSHLEYSKIPDFFTRCFTQVPLFAIDEYRLLLEDFGRVSISNSADPVEFNEWLTRLYWHSIEKGLLSTSNRFYSIGSLLLGSPEESAHATFNTQVKPFGMHPVIRTPVSQDKHASLYYSFESFLQVRKSLLDLEKFYKNA